MRLSYDDNYLFSVAADGSLFCYRVTDKDGRGYRKDKDVAYAEEVLVTKSDMEELVGVFVGILASVSSTPCIIHVHVDMCSQRSL